MSAIDSLPPQQRAVLSLVLQKGRSYTEIAGLLQISEESVRERAAAALDALAPQGSVPLPPARRYEIGDYLLGQQSTSESQHTLAFLAESAEGRAWARAVAGELRPLASFELPGIPGESTGAQRTPSSRRGGAALLLAIVGIGVLIAAVAILKNHTGSTKTFAPGSATTSATGSTGGTGASGATGSMDIEHQVNLNPPGPHSKAKGIGYIVLDGQSTVLVIQAEGLKPNSKTRPAYAVWLYNDHAHAERLGYAGRVTSNGRLAAYAQAPANMSSYRALIVTIEYTANSKAPGPIVLAGPLTGHSLR